MGVAVLGSQLGQELRYDGGQGLLYLPYAGQRRDRRDRRDWSGLVGAGVGVRVLGWCSVGVVGVEMFR